MTFKNHLIIYDKIEMHSVHDGEIINSIIYQFFCCFNLLERIVITEDF